MARLFKREPDGFWYADYLTPEGKRVQRSTRTRDKAVAKQRGREAELAASPSTGRRKQRLSEAIDYMIVATCHDLAAATRAFYEQKGRRVITTLGDPWIHEITRDTLSSYIARRLGDDPDHGGAEPHTLHKELITIRKSLREAHERGVLAVMPAIPRFSPRYKPREVWLTVDEFVRVTAQLQWRPDKRDHKYAKQRRGRRPTRQRPPATNRVLWVSIAALAGGSLSEVESLDWSDVNLETRWLRLRGEKRETRTRSVPISPALAARLIEAGPQSSGPVVAHWGNVRRALKEACERAGVKRVSPNDLRRTFASWLVQSGVPLFTVATLMGHSSTRMVERVYGRLSRANLEEAIRVLPQLFTGPPLPGVTDGVTNLVALPSATDNSGDEAPAPPLAAVEA